MRMSKNKLCLWGLLLACSTRILADVICKNPDFDIDPPPIGKKKFVLLSPPVNGGGIGNQLVFYPVQYFYAILTGRYIVIHDDGLLAEICNVITCGFPFMSKVRAAFPDSLTEDVVHSKIKVLRINEVVRQFMDQNNYDDEIVMPAGVLRKSDWWLWMNGTTECVMRVTGCGWGDVGCSEKYAFQSLIKGPFRSITTKQEERITGIPHHVKRGILNLPRTLAPRIEIAVHMRAQFKYFESQTESNHSLYQWEVADWLNSTQGVNVFSAYEEKIVIELTKLGLYNDSTQQAHIYVAADNEQLKDAFISMMNVKHPTVEIMRVETEGIIHVKNLQVAKSLSKGESGFDLAFDWYALSLSKIILAWRRDTGMRSTFVQTASYVSGCVGYYLQGDRHGVLSWHGL